MKTKAFSRSTILKFNALFLLFVCGLVFGSPEILAQTRKKTTSSVAKKTNNVPRGTQMKIRLESTIDSSEARSGDRFKATVLSPKRYADSTLEGHVTRVKQSGKLKGKTVVNLVFDRIQFDEGGSDTLGAEVVRIYGNDSAKVGDEGEIKSGSRGDSTTKRTAGGAVAGAIIGGIAGGGKGAAIGAAIGGGVGAGSNYIRGTSKVKIEEGTEILIRVSR
jgi:hypothetical protein